MTAQEALGLGLQGSIMLTVLGFGLGATFAEANYLFHQPALLLRCVLSMNVVMPLIVIAATRALDLPFEIRVALVAISISPVPPILQKNQLGAGGRIEFVTGLLVAMSALAIVLVPLWVWIIDRVFSHHGELYPLAVAKVMLTTVFVPLTLGLLIRRFVPAARRASAPVMTIAGAMLAIVAVILIWGLREQVMALIGNGLILVIVAIVVVGLDRRPPARRADRGLTAPPLAMATASRHPAVALAVATSGAAVEAKPELAIILLYLVVATVVSIPYRRWRHRGLAKAA
jgi:BASS family bile acid:Na+ symporter